MEYNKKLDNLFDRWEQEAKMKGFNGFCRDGLLYKGKIWNTIGSDGKTYFGRGPGNEDELWYNANKKIIFLTKDTNSNPNQDYREWLGRQGEGIITHKFFKNIAIWLYGLSSFDSQGKYSTFEEAAIGENYTRAFDEIPFCIVNAKKESGGPKINNADLLYHANLSARFLKEQFEILSPDIIVCGGGQGSVLKVAKEIIYPELEFIKINNWIYFNAETQKVLIDSYHPSAIISYEEMYLGMMNSYKEFLEKER
ncbi:hypothetical protein [Marinifilum flexuosum]|uniref:Uracil DNA glycosylase superfamily protein n=1 Tax=Marinifilum flexuosum TaxID=1117708 RepID=A0A419X9D0_9BACT|nr:hypothetical protein [Marinifilum flexuosum]RKE04170.1 hypothetical protein BXY64_1186 [Marinifilum flexuosum]